MFEINGTYVIFIAMFLVFMYFLNEIMLKPVGKVIEERKAGIQNDYEAAQASAHEQNTVLTRYQHHMHEAREKAQGIIAESQTSAQSKRDQELKRIHAEGSERVNAMKIELDNERETLIHSMVDSELDLVKEITSKLLSEPATVSISKETVQRALEGAK